MLLAINDLVQAFKKVRHVREEYDGKVFGTPHNHLSVDELTWVVGDMYDVEIQRFEVDFEARYTRGMMRRTRREGDKDLVEIDVRLSLENSWKRLTVVKELSHVVVDEPEDWSVDATRTIEDLQTDGPSIEHLAARTSASETLAELAAIELMYPYTQRLYDQGKRAANGLTLSQIANSHGMPQAIVSRSLLEASMSLAKEVWTKVGED